MVRLVSRFRVFESQSLYGSTQGSWITTALHLKVSEAQAEGKSVIAAELAIGWIPPLISVLEFQMTISLIRRLRSSALFALRFSLAMLTAVCVSAQETNVAARLPASSSAQPTKAPTLDVASFSDRFVAVGIRGLIFASKDQGVSWEQRPSPIDVTLTSLVYVGPKRGFAVGHEETILRTDDNGATWNVAHTDAAGVPLLRIRFFNSEKGFALGGRGVIYSTENGGDLWTRKVVTTDDGFDPHLFDIVALDAGRLMLAGEAGRLFRSSDDGDGWRELQSPYIGSFFGLVGLGPRTVLAYGMLGHVFLTRDGGDTWGQICAGTNLSLFGAAATSDRVYLAGADGAIVTMRRSDPGLCALEGVPDRVTISALVPTSSGWVLASDRGLRRIATFATNLPNE
jgi:photosystem II stability/assembly factor-like uncharacterized protein